MRTAFALGLLGLLAALSTPASKPPRMITHAEARTLVLKALQAQGTPTKSPKFDLEDNTGAPKYYPGFYFFDAYFNNPLVLTAIGHYAVNRRTADLWEWIGCHRLGPPAIKRLQKALRRKINLSAAEYRKLSKEAPCSPNP